MVEEGRHYNHIAEVSMQVAKCEEVDPLLSPQLTHIREYLASLESYMLVASCQYFEGVSSESGHSCEHKILSEGKLSGIFAQGGEEGKELNEVSGCLRNDSTEQALQPASLSREILNMLGEVDLDDRALVDNGGLEDAVGREDFQRVEHHHQCHLIYFII